MKNKLLLLISGFMFIGYVARAQDSRVTLNLNYNYSFPTGSFHSNAVSDGSPRGFTGNLMYQINPKLSVGLGFGYQDYYQRYGRQLYNLGKGQTISAVLTNSIQTVPALAEFQYTPFGGSLGAVEPYVSVAAGLNFINYSQYLGEFPNTITNTGFRLQGGLGMKVPLGLSRNWGVDVGGSYDYAPYKKAGFDNLDNINVHAGLYLNLK